MSNRQMLKVLDKGDLDAIHGASLQVLERTGVLVNSDGHLDLLEKKGLAVDRRSRVVKMPETVVMEAVKNAKRNFKWHARSERNTIQVVDGRTKVGPGAECSHYIDPDTDKARSPTLEDGLACCRLLDAMPNVQIAYVPVTITDIPDQTASRMLQMAGGLINSSKCTFGGSVNRDDVEMSIRLGEAILGDREKLKKKPLFCGYVDPISPLAHEHTMLEALTGYASMEMPVFITVMALAGGTAPASLAGLLVQMNAEVLSSIVIMSTVTRTPKAIYGSVSCPLDMRTGISVTGSPEFSLIGVGAIQMARYYHLPSNMGIQSDSKTVDAQTAYEKAFAALAAVSAGADFCDLFIGSTEAFNSWSPVQAIIDDEIASNAFRFAQGIEVNDDTLSVEVINKVGPMGNFLKQKDTMVHFRKEHSLPGLTDRNTRTAWEAAGSKDARRRAKERMVEILNSHTPEPLETEVRKNIDSLIREYTKTYGADSLEKRS